MAMQERAGLGTWHVRFDGKPEVEGHICDVHRDVGQSLACPTDGLEGDCAHVQTAPCDCAEPVRCDGCS